MTESSQSYLKTWGIMWAVFAVVIIMFIASYTRIDSLNDEIGDVKNQLEARIDSSKDYLSTRIDGVLVEIGKVNARIDDVYRVCLSYQSRKRRMINEL